MASNINDFEKQLLQLSAHERAFLAKQLIQSLDDDVEEEGELEQQWIEEAQRRYDEYQSGKTTAKSADQVIKNARSKLL